MKKLLLVTAVVGCILAECLAMNVSAEEPTTQPDYTNYGTDHCIPDEWETETEDETIHFIENPEPCSGDYGALHWDYADNVLTISGQGERPAGEILRPWVAISHAVHTIIIEDGVTVIGRYIFGSFENLTSVSIPDSVTKIGENAFYGNRSLESIVIPDSVTEIGDYAFAFCDNLRDVTLSKNLTSVGRYSFYTTPWFISIQQDGAEDLLTVDGDILFEAVKIHGDFVIPDGIRVIANHAFYEQNFATSITIPDSVEYIGDYAFYDCTFLESLTIPENVKSIGANSFMGCKKLKNITYPASLEYLGFQQYSEKLQSLTFLNPNCEIGEQMMITPYVGTIYGYPNSTAEALTKENGWKFVPLEDTPENVPEVSGDANGDGEFSLVDVVQVHKMLLNRKAPPKSCDLNGDNVVNVIDLSLMKHKIFGNRA